MSCRNNYRFNNTGCNNNVVGRSYNPCTGDVTITRRSCNECTGLPVTTTTTTNVCTGESNTTTTTCDPCGNAVVTSNSGCNNAVNGGIIYNTNAVYPTANSCGNYPTGLQTIGSSCTDNACGNVSGETKALENMPIGMAYVPWQEYNNLYSLSQGLNNGTMFRSLDYDFKGRRCN